MLMHIIWEVLTFMMTIIVEMSLITLIGLINVSKIKAKVRFSFDDFFIPVLDIYSSYCFFVATFYNICKRQTF